jgi:hypothetical protein
MKRLMALAGAVALATVALAVPASATTTRIAVHCDETRLTEWVGGHEWVDEDFVLHVRGGSADYLDVGSVFCAGINHATVSVVNLDLATGEGLVVVTAHRELAAFDGGWDARLVAHFTPAGPYIWEGQVVGHGFGELTGYQYRSTVYETTHEAAIEDGFVFLPGD